MVPEAQTILSSEISGQKNWDQLGFSTSFLRLITANDSSRLNGDTSVSSVSSGKQLHMA